MCPEVHALDGVYNFPPFFTLQPNETTRQKQFGLWKDVLISNKVFMITKGELDPYAVSQLCKFLETSSLGEWIIDEEKFLFYQRPIIEWADELHEWVIQTGRNNSVETLFSIMHEVPPELLKSAPIELVHRAFKVLERSKKCEIFEDTVSGTSSVNLEKLGVKFFP